MKCLEFIWSGKLITYINKILWSLNHITDIIDTLVNIYIYACAKGRWRGLLLLKQRGKRWVIKLHNKREKGFCFQLWQPGKSCALNISPQPIEWKLDKNIYKKWPCLYALISISWWLRNLFPHAVQAKEGYKKTTLLS